MIRETLVRQLDHDPRFSWRGEAVTRVENLSDIVFALALGMLVSSAERPQTFTDLTAHLMTIVPVAAGFALLYTIWNAHFTYFRRYGVADGTIVFLNCVLLLLVLFLAYPLRFIFDGLFGVVLGMGLGDWSVLEAAEIGFRESGIIMGYFTAGYALVYLVISLMYSHALSRADLLDLNASEITMTKQSIWMFRCMIAVAVIVGLLAVLTPLRSSAAMFMALLWPAGMTMRRVFRVKPDDASEIHND
jgi:uncharacterized membrane protein